MAVVSSVSAVLAGLNAVRGWQEDFYRTCIGTPSYPTKSGGPPRRSASALARLATTCTRVSVALVWSGC